MVSLRPELALDGFGAHWYSHTDGAACNLEANGYLIDRRKDGPKKWRTELRFW